MERKTKNNQKLAKTRDNFSSIFVSISILSANSNCCLSISQSTKLPGSRVISNKHCADSIWTIKTFQYSNCIQNETQTLVNLVSPSLLWISVLSAPLQLKWPPFYQHWAAFPRQLLQYHLFPWATHASQGRLDPFQANLTFSECFSLMPTIPRSVPLAHFQSQDWHLNLYFLCFHYLGKTLSTEDRSWLMSTLH